MSDDLISNSASSDTDVGITSLSDRRKIKALEAQVENLSAKLGEALEHVKPGMTKAPRAGCYHQGSFEVADDMLEVRCQVCNALMDPYTVLRKIAMREVNFCYTLNALRTESERLKAQNAKAKARLSRLRASIRKACPDVATTELAAFIRRVEAKAFVVQQYPGVGSWTASFRFGDGLRGTQGHGTAPEVAMRDAMDKADPSRVDDLPEVGAS